MKLRFDKELIQEILLCIAYYFILSICLAIGLIIYFGICALATQIPVVGSILGLIILLSPFGVLMVFLWRRD